GTCDSQGHRGGRQVSASCSWAVFLLWGRLPRVQFLRPPVRRVTKASALGRSTNRGGDYGQGAGLELLMRVSTYLVFALSSIVNVSTSYAEPADELTRSSPSIGPEQPVLAV